MKNQIQQITFFLLLGVGALSLKPLTPCNPYFLFQISANLACNHDYYSTVRFTFLLRRLLVREGVAQFLTKEREAARFGIDKGRGGFKNP